MTHYGIDLGTRNTAVECGALKLVSRAGSTIPSAVAYDTLTGDKRFGEAALQLLREPNPLDRWQVVTSFKTSLHSDAAIVRTANGALNASDVLRDFFEHLATEAERQSAPPLAHAVFAIPVGFCAKSRQRLLDAARRARIEPCGIVSEPTAAFLNIEEGIGGAEHVAVVDWGAGTLDVSILRISGARATGLYIEELACQGSVVAGDRFDLSIYELFATRARTGGSAVPPIDTLPLELWRAIRHECEMAKIALCEPGIARKEVQVDFKKFSNLKHASFRLTADELKSVTKVHREEAFAVVMQVIEQAGMNVERLDRIIFVGGCTLLCGVREEAQAIFQGRATFPASPEWVVASGALQVANGKAAYSSLQEFGCILDDGTFLPLSHHRQFGGDPSDVSVAATDTTGRASLIFADRQGARISVATSVSIPLQGHVGEPIIIRTRLCHDLTVSIKSWSECADDVLDAVTVEITDTRFRFTVMP